MTATMLMVALSLAPAAAGSGGGGVDNALPTVPSFVLDSANPANQLSSATFSGLVNDTNGESDLLQVKLSKVSGPGAFTDMEATIVAADLAQTTEPAMFAGGWKLWNAVADDGQLAFRVTMTYPSEAGTYTFRFSVKDEGAYQSATDIQVQVLDRITVSATPLRADGTADTGTAWGNWLGLPGQQDVSSTNYLMVQNTGVTPGQQFQVDFSSSHFLGADGLSQVPINGVIRYICREDTTPATSTPGEVGGFAPSSVSADGSVTCTFTGTDNIMYVFYDIDVPAVMKDQAYTAGYTVAAV